VREASFAVPRAAKLGQYDVELRLPGRSLQSGSFRVEAFRLPVLQGQVARWTRGRWCARASCRWPCAWTM
jgi:uncharacterized protein YfaS (alpha-2-macroglobulin family)